MLIEGGDQCRGVCEMRVTAEAAQRFLDQERGMRDALTNALQYVTPDHLCMLTATLTGTPFFSTAVHRKWITPAQLTVCMSASHILT